MYIAYNNYVALHQQNEAPCYPNFVASNLGRRSIVKNHCADVNIIATSSGSDGSRRDSREDERQIHAKMLEQGTLHKCAMLQYNNGKNNFIG